MSALDVVCGPKLLVIRIAALSDDGGTCHWPACIKFHGRLADTYSYSDFLDTSDTNCWCTSRINHPFGGDHQKSLHDRNHAAGCIDPGSVNRRYGEGINGGWYVGSIERHDGIFPTSTLDVSRPAARSRLSLSAQWEMRMTAMFRRATGGLFAAGLLIAALSTSANAATAGHMTGPAVIPLSASGCAGPFAEVCVDVEGTGLNVRTIKGSEFVSTEVTNGSHNWCGVLTYRITLGASTLFSTMSPRGCTTQAHPSFQFTETVNASFPSGALVCADQRTDAGFYNPASGPACETLHG
jgi:hypothetical protein